MKPILYFYMLVLIFSVVNGVFFEPFFSVSNHQLHMVMGLVIIIYFFLFLTRYFQVVDNQPISAFPLFWVGLGWMLFSIVSIVGFGFNRLITNNPNWNGFVTEAKIYSNYLLYASFIPAFLCPQKSLNDFTPGK